MTWYLIFALLTLPLLIGLLYGLIERLTARWLKSNGWQIREEEEGNLGWEPEHTYNLPPSRQWLTLWEACRKQLKTGRHRG